MFVLSVCLYASPGLGTFFLLGEVDRNLDMQPVTGDGLAEAQSFRILIVELVCQDHGVLLSPLTSGLTPPTLI